MHRNIFTFLIFLAFSTLLAQSLEITDFQRVDSDISARVTAPKMDNYGKPMALLKISTALTGVSVTGTGYCEVEAHTGELWVFVNEGTFNIKVAVKGYERLVYPLPETAKSAIVYRMKLRGEKVADQIPVSFITKPEDAEKWLDGELLGTGESFSVAPGNYALEVRKGGYQTYRETITVDGNNVLFKDIVLLESMPAVVKIDSSPQGATVYIDNIKFGVTPAESFFDSGTYPIRIELQNYDTIETQITITEPETQKNYTLTDIRASITVKTNPEARVIFDGKIYPGGIDNLTVLPRTIQLRVEQGYCEAIEQTYTLIDGEDKVFEIYPEDIAATLTVRTNPNARIHFNDQNFKGGVENYKIMPQVLLITAEQPKAKSKETTRVLRPKETVTIEIYPEIETGNVQLVTIPTDAKWLLVGDAGESYEGVGRGSITDVPIGNYELNVNADGYKKHHELFELVAGETVRKQVQLKEGSDIVSFKSAIGIEMIAVIGGNFQMGSESGSSDEKPVHTVAVRDFYIGKYEVKQSQWEAVMGRKTSQQSGNDSPADNISWNDAIEFCNKLSEKEGLTPCYSGSGKRTKCNFIANGYRLPTEAEWEYVAKGGMENEQFAFSGSNNCDEVGWYSVNSSRHTHPAGVKQPNGIGVYDMSGNVWELCWDWYDSNYYKDSPLDNPTGPSHGSKRVRRGGGWDNQETNCTVSSRQQASLSRSFPNIGFRLCRSVD